MAGVSTGVRFDNNLANLKEMSLTEMRPEINGLLIEGESIVSTYKTIRDQVIFTNKRIIVANVQGLSGKKVAYFFYPYSKIQFYGVETAGLMDIDCEFIAVFSNGTVLQLDFKSKVDVKQLSNMISQFIL